METIFKELTIVQKINAIDKIIEDNVKDFLAQDGGDLDLLDVKETNDMTDVFIMYLGACSGCASGGSTLSGIERILNARLETKTIRVHEV